MQCTINVRSRTLARQILAKTRNLPNIIARQNLLIYSNMDSTNPFIRTSLHPQHTFSRTSPPLAQYVQFLKFRKAVQRNFDYIEWDADRRALFPPTLLTSKALRVCEGLTPGLRCIKILTHQIFLDGQFFSSSNFPTSHDVLHKTCCDVM